MYAKIKDGKVIKFPYNEKNLQEENPYTKFNSSSIAECFIGTDENIAGAQLIEVQVENKPQYDEKVQKLELKPFPEQKNGQWIVEYVVVSKTQEEIANDTALRSGIVRKERDDKLKECDWTQLSDAPVNSLAWANYRQMLRDIPQQSGFPWNINWPIQPE